MGIISRLLSRLLKASPFSSESLDNLADAMQVTKILRVGKLERYFNVGFLAVGGMAFLDRIFFDNTYLGILLPEELLAVGAHEFTHLKKRHGTKKFFRLTVPAAIVGVLMGFFVFSNFIPIDSISLVGSLGRVVFSLLTALFFGFFALFAGLYVNATWLRQLETDCDLSSVKFLNGEPMIPALIKLNNLRPRRNTRVEKWLPKIYPTIEQRINDVRVAVENKKKEKLPL
ncbi:MAG TPA: M48 family metalloprotease [Candidatus Bathyarchaeia archaeon]